MLKLITLLTSGFVTLAVNTSSGDGAVAFAAPSPLPFALAPSFFSNASAHLAVFDADGDGASDVLLTGAPGVSTLLLAGSDTQPPFFPDTSVAAALASLGNITCAVVVDVWMDGLVDLVVVAQPGLVYVPPCYTAKGPP